MAAPLSQVLNTARTYLNDDTAVQFPDPVLIPKVQEAHRELQEELWIVGSPLVRAQSGVIVYTSPNLSITPPADMLCPMALFENAVGSLSTSAGWIPMTEAFFIPLGAAQAATLGFWAWIGEQIVLAGASANRTVIIQYRKKIPIPSGVNDDIGVLFGESYLAARAAAIGAGSLGNMDVYTAMTALAKENFAKVIAANRGSQRPLMKP